jgi:hypothetical protein
MTIARMPTTTLPTLSMPRRSHGHARLRRTIYGPIDDHRTAASNSDIGAAWVAVGLVALALLAALPF